MPALKIRRQTRTSPKPCDNSLSLERLEPRMMLSTVEILAAGSENTETMDLEIDGSVVESWQDVGGDADAGVFESYTFTTPETVTPGQVRIILNNSVWNPANGIDENLRIDAMIIDGVRYETEADDVYSTGTWTPVDGIAPGFRNSEFLHGDGYFLFADPIAGESTRIVVNAAGTDGPETMALQIDGVTVRTWNNVGTTLRAFTHIAEGVVAADQVRVEFLNDVYDPANGIDHNLIVDNIIIDDISYQTEAPEVFSTGTWTAADGIVPGFRTSEVLHSAGYFQYAEPVQGDATQIVINAAGSEGPESMALLIDGVTVRTWDNIGTNIGPFAYVAEGIVSADQIRIAFLNDDYDPANGIDRNLIVDNVVIDGVLYETEAPEVFSTGTWTDEDNGIVPGFGRGSTLHVNGYFQYSSGPAAGGNLSLESSQYVVSEGAGSVTIRIVRTGGSTGVVSLDYATIDSTAVAGEDYIARSGTVTFADGQTSGSITIPITDDSDIETDEEFSFAIDNLVGNATLLAPRTATITIDDNDAVLGQGNGLLGEYFNNFDLTNRFATRVDATVAFDWDTAAPIAGMGVDTFSVRWTGQVEAELTETYTFHTLSDDGIRLWVDNQLIINEWYDHSVLEHMGQIDLEAGVRYDIRIEYYENAGLAVAELRWSSASQTLEVVPQSQLYAAEDPGPDPGDTIQAVTLFSGLAQPTSIDFSPDGRNTYISLKSGIVRVARDGDLASTPFVDISDQVNDVRDRGLLDIAVHPDFENNPYVYLLYTYDPPKVFENLGHNLAGPDRPGNRAGRLIRVTADVSTDYTTAVANSEVVLLGTNSIWDNFNAFANSTSDFDEPPAGILDDGTNIRDFIASDSESHTVGALAFGIDGNLFVSIGDGTSYNRVDPRTVRVQDIDNLSGKVLRIDPLTGEGLTDNPFFNGDADANRSKVYQYGLRNPFRLTVDPSTGQLYVGDVGWTQWEEVNAAGPGANFGWPYYEGGSGTSLRTNGYDSLPEAQAFYASGQPVTSSIYALNHAASGINAIVLGDVYRGTAYPAEYQGNLFINDLGQGVVRAISFDASGNVDTVRTFTTGARIVVNMVEGPDGTMHYVDLDDGTIGHWVFV